MSFQVHQLHVVTSAAKAALADGRMGVGRNMPIVIAGMLRFTPRRLAKAA
jgi:hypothetical protein